MAAPVYPPPTPGVLRVTQSSLREYLRCGIAYQFHQEEKGVRHATVRMLVGSAVDAGAAADNEHKIRHGRALPVADIVEWAAADYEEEQAASEVAVTSNLELAQGKDDAVAAARTFATDLSPRIDPIAAQVPMVALLPRRGIELAGTPDYVGAIGLGDLKVGRAWTQQQADRAHQLTAYSILHRIHFGRWPGNTSLSEGAISKVWIDSLSQHRGVWMAERIHSFRDSRHVTAFLEVVDRAVAGMQAGIALPAPEGSWACTPAWCPWWGRCPAVGGGR